MADFKYQLEAEKSYPAVVSATPATTYVDPSDGTVYEWDEKQRGWVPKVDSIKYPPL
jgi:hypothetical protein